MPTTAASFFSLRDTSQAKAAPELTSLDERHFTRIAEVIERKINDLTERRDEFRRARGVDGQDAVERDVEIHRLTKRLNTLSRFGVDLCVGYIVREGEQEPLYIGRLGLADEDGRQLLVDWRSPAAEPFFGATHANPMGLVRRRRYRWAGGRVSDYWDEAFTSEALRDTTALDEQSAFIATLGTARSSRMRDVLSTIQADQDAIIRAGSRGATVVDGGPGTGKTVVALHRAAYLVYSEPRLTRGGGGILFVGPHRSYLAYVDDVLPSLGEDSVHSCTLGELVPEGASARPENDSRVRDLKATMAMVDAVEYAVRLYERPPAADFLVETDWFDLTMRAADWEYAFSVADPTMPHNEAREHVWQEVMQTLIEANPGIPAERLRRILGQHDELRSAFDRAWPMLEPAGIIAAFWSHPSFLARCAPHLGQEDVQTLQRAESHAWTRADLPLLDVARQLIGDPETALRRRRQRAALADERERMARVAELMVDADDDGEGVVTMLSGRDLQDTLVDEADFLSDEIDPLAGPFAHIVVDEAQDLSDAEWSMLIRRCPSKSFTIVGDRAQAPRPFLESWAERLDRVGMRSVTLAPLNVNYRTPAEIMSEAEPVIRAVLPDANVPRSIRSREGSFARRARGEGATLIDTWLGEHTDGIVCVVTADGETPSWMSASERVRVLSPSEAKGMEFDLVLLDRPETFGDGVAGAVHRYVAMTRATRQLVILD